MVTRIAIAAIGIPLFLGLLFWPGGIPFVCLCFLLACVGTWEMARVIDPSSTGTTVSWTVIALILLFGCSVVPAAAPYRTEAAFAYLILLISGGVLIGNLAPFRRTSVILFIGAYASLFTVPAMMRLQSPVFPTMGLSPVSDIRPADPGAVWVGIALVMVWVTDSAAYFVGRSIGRRRLAPRLSPNKTWEGALGGWIGAVAVGGVIGAWSGWLDGGLASGLALGALAGAGGQIGDLVESGLKRELGVKDLGGWLPGHGGVMDRFDSFLFVCPLVAFWRALGW